MIKAEIDPRDLREMHRDLDALHPKELLRGEQDPMGRSVIRDAGVYPPAGIGNKRTGELGRKWYHRVHGLDLTVGNLAVYAGYVHGEEQRSYHGLRGWKRLFKVAVTQADKLYKKLERKVDQIWR